MKLIQLRKLIREELTKQMEMSEVVSGRSTGMGDGMDLYISFGDYENPRDSVLFFGPIPIRANSEEEFKANALRIAGTKSPEIRNAIKGAEQATDPLDKIHTMSITVDPNDAWNWPGLASFVGEEVYMCYRDNNYIALYMVGFPKGTDLRGIGNIGGFVQQYM
jgi:hypothetical protein